MNCAEEIYQFNAILTLAIHMQLLSIYRNCKTHLIEFQDISFQCNLAINSLNPKISASVQPENRTVERVTSLTVS